MARRIDASAGHLRTRSATALSALSLSFLHVVSSPAFAETEPAETLTGTVYLPDGVTPAPAAAVDLMVADTAGLPVAGSAFTRSVTDLDGRFVLDPRERADLVAAAKARGGTLPVVIQVGKLANHGSIDPAATEGVRTPDTALAMVPTALTLRSREGSAEDVAFTFSGHLPEPRLGTGVVGDIARDATGNAEVVLDLADDALRTASVLGMFTDRDLVAGNDNPDDPDLVPPLMAIMTDVAATLDLTAEASPDDVGGLNLDVSRLRPPQPDNDSGGEGSCGKDPNTQWVSSRHGNNIEGTKTYVYLDTYSCTKDKDPERDEFVYKWGGYTGSADKHWTIYRLKYRTEISDKYDYFMKYPDPAGDRVDNDGGNLTWNVGFEYFLTASVGGSYNFRAKKIHGWQGDGVGRLYHVSWINNSRDGRYGEGFNNGGGVNVDVPEGTDGRTGITNSVIVWRCWWPDGYDGSDDDGTGPWKPRCDG